MESVLIVPDSPARRRAHVRLRSRLTWPTSQSKDEHGLGVIIDHRWSVLDGYNFRILRDGLGAKILTMHPDRVCRALDVPEGEPGIEKPTG